MTDKEQIVGVCNTTGDGFWSDTAKSVTITKLTISYLDKDNLFDSLYGELRAYFDAASWDIQEDGLIYSDLGWISEFKALLISHGFSRRAVLSIYYSEQGMQGEDYVSMDITEPFIRECDKLLSFVNNQPKTIEIELEE